MKDTENKSKTINLADMKCLVVFVVPNSRSCNEFFMQSYYDTESERKTFLTANNRKESYKKLREAYRLTDREEEVLVLLTAGFSRKAIAEKLFVSQNTVGAHVKSIYSKTHCHKKDEVIRLVETYEAERED